MLDGRSKVLSFTPLTFLSTPPWLRRIGLIVGVLLLVGAILTIWVQRQTIDQAWQAVGQLPPGRLVTYAAILAGSIVANMVLSGLLFSLLMSRYGRVGLLEMQALIASATLINYFPMRPGLFGRIAYHKAANQIAVIDSAKATVTAMILTVFAAVSCAAAVFITKQIAVDLRIILPAIPLMLAGGGLLWPRRRVWLWAASLRCTEVLVIAARYSAAFAVIGSPIDARTALALACISVIATMAPLVSNGLGLREWAIGLAAPLLTHYQVESGITADLVNRAAEIVMALLCGGMGMAYLARDARQMALIPRSRSVNKESNT